MPTLTCPGCGAVVSFERANKYGSIRCQVRCQECDQWFRLDSFQPAALDEAALADPPSGARFERLANGFTVAVSGRTCDALLIFFGLPCFALFAGIALARRCSGWCGAPSMKGISHIRRQAGCWALSREMSSPCSIRE